MRLLNNFGVGLVVGVVVGFALTGCGGLERRDCYLLGTNCSEEVEDGRDGDQGEAGPAGVRGTPGVAGAAGQPGVAGPSGDPGIDGVIGASGSNGNDGATGPVGPDGFSIVTQLTPSVLCDDGGTTIVIATDTNRNGVFDGGDTNVQVTDICNGAAGEDGLPGADAPPVQYTISDMIDPCGDTLGVFDEVLLRLANGTILASFSDNANGLNTRLSVLIPGSFITTDGSMCHFNYDGSSVVW